MRALLIVAAMAGIAWTVEPAWDPTKPAAVFTAPQRQVQPPPAPVFRVQDYGAVGDGSTYDTAAIQKAIDACAGSGGSVVLEGGRFVAAALTLRGGMTFYVAKGAALLGGLEAADYPVVMPKAPDHTSAKAIQRSLLYAFAAHKLVIDGEGEIDGRGKQVKMDGKEPERPSLLRIFGSDDVTVRNITLRNPRMWTAVYSECRRLAIIGTTTDAPAYCPNLDGMDICDSQDVEIRDNRVSSEDDGICLKTHGTDGLRNIRISNNLISCHRANGIKIGTASRGPISGLRIIGNVVEHAQYAGLCLESVDGSAMDDVVVRGLEMHRVAQPLFIRLAARNTSGTGTMGGITIERVRAIDTHGKTGTSTSTITGLPGQRITGVTVRDVLLDVPGGGTKVPGEPPERPAEYPQSNLLGQTPACALFVRHADGVRLERVTVRIRRPDVRPWLATTDATVETADCSPLR